MPRTCSGNCRFPRGPCAARTRPTRSARRCAPSRSRSRTTQRSRRGRLRRRAAEDRTALPAKGDLRNGNNLYHGKCGACHGGQAEGNAALRAPRLAGLDAAYIRRQFAHFRDGLRGTDPKDIPGRQMAMMAKTLPTERDLDDVIAYIHQQGRPK